MMSSSKILLSKLLKTNQIIIIQTQRVKNPVDQEPFCQYRYNLNNISKITKAA